MLLTGGFYISGNIKLLLPKEEDDPFLKSFTLDSSSSLNLTLLSEAVAREEAFLFSALDLLISTLYFNYVS